MTKIIRTVKASIVMGLLLVSIFTAIAPTSSAGYVLKLGSYVTVDWSQQANGSALKPIVPLGEQAQLTLDVTYGVTSGAFPSQLVLALYQGRQVHINLDVADRSPWCTATLASSTLITVIGTNQPLKMVLTLSVVEDAPAFESGYVNIKVSVDKIGPIDAFSQIYSLRFQPAYLPMISPQLPEGNSKTIGPMDTAVFPIEVDNLGNARTTVSFKVDNVPEGWVAVVTDEITLDAGKGSKGIVYLTIKPTKGFGYHNDDVSITVTMTPARAEDTKNQGEPKTVTVIVESRGFSTPGFEPVLFIGALLAVILIVKLKRKK